MIGEIIKCKNRIKKKNKIMERVPVTVKLWKANINAIIPPYAKNGDAGMDLTAVQTPNVILRVLLVLLLKIMNMIILITLVIELLK